MRSTHRPLLASALCLLPATASAQTAPVTAATTPVNASPPPPPPSETGQPAAVTAELGRGATIQTLDGRYSLNLRGRAQVRFTASEQPERPQTEFQIRRLRLVLQGNLLGPDLRYVIHLGFSNLDNEPDLRIPLRDAFLSWNAARDLQVRFGQMKVPFGRQRLVSSAYFQFVDMAIGTQELNLDRDVGVVLFSRDLFGLGRRLTYDLGVFGGDGHRLTTDAGLLYTARLQLQPFGDYDDNVEADTLRLARPRLALAASAAYNHRSRRARSTVGDTYQQPFDQYHVAVDIQFKWRGLSLQAEGLYRQADDHAHALGNDAMGRPTYERSRSGLGYYVQAGYLVTRHVEVAARWGEVIPNGGAADALLRARELGGALSWYLQRHDLKLQADYFYLAGHDLSAGRHQARLHAQLFF